MKKWNVEISWNGAYGSDEWQVANEDGPIEAATAEEAEDMLSPEFLEEHMSTIYEAGEMVPVEGAEYRVVEIEDEACELDNLTSDEIDALQQLLQDCPGDAYEFRSYFAKGEALTLNICRNGREVAWCVWSESNESCRYVDNLKPLSAAEIEEQLP